MEKHPEISKLGAFNIYPIKKVVVLNLSDAYLLSISFINSIIFSVASRLPMLRSSRSLITFLLLLVNTRKNLPNFLEGLLIYFYLLDMRILFKSSVFLYQIQHFFRRIESIYPLVRKTYSDFFSV